MKYMKRYRNRYILTLTILLAAWIAGGNVMAQGVQVHGSVFGGGNAADVKINTTVNIGGGQIDGNVYGGGNVGSVGTYETSADMKTFTFTANTGTCDVTISGGTIGTGVTMSADGTFADGNVYGAGKGKADTYWCEKAMAFKANLAINAGTVNGTVYGGGQIGRVENDATVTIGVETPSDETITPIIVGNVFGAGAGLATHGYSALLRGDTEVTVQGYAQVGHSVYGGGEKASVGRFKIVEGLPSEPQDGGTCKVTVKGNAKIGTSGTDHNVFGSCQGVTAPTSWTAYDHAYKSMQTAENAPPDASAWEYVENTGQKYIWEYYPTLDAYKGFLNTLALASHTDVEVGGSASVYGSVFGGGQMGITLGNVDVDITGGTVYDDVYGGGALADTNKGNQTAEKYDVATVTVNETVVTGMYERTGDTEPYTYTEITEPNTKAASGKTYCTKASQSSINTTTVNLTGGLIMGDAYGGGLGKKDGFNGKSGDIAAVVWGDISVNLGTPGTAATNESPAIPGTATAFQTSYYVDEGHPDVVKSGRVFGCNNLLGSPQGEVTVKVYKTVPGKDGANTAINRTTPEAIANNKVIKENHPDDFESIEGYVFPTYEVAAVYGGGNLANYTATGKKASVRIETCEVSVQSVYGGGNAAEVPETDVLVRGAYEIQEVFGGGNGKDKYQKGTEWIVNAGANVGSPTTPGNATTLLTGGYIHEAYGGSNKKGTIYGNVSIDMGEGSVEAQTKGDCTLLVEQLVGAGKDADVDGDIIMVMGCKPDTKTPLLFAGANNANVNGNIELTITSGRYGKVFGGNNKGGIILGHIILNIEETGDCEVPIEIDELYLGGNQAAYSMYGYYNSGTTTDPVYTPRTAAMAAITNPAAEGYTPVITTEDFGGTEIRRQPPYDAPVLNVISCTYIGEVFGGGYGSGATLYGDPIVNINMIPGSHSGNSLPAKMTSLSLTATDNPNNLGIIGNVYGGGNAASVYGNTTVNIGTEETVTLTSIGDDPSTDINEQTPTVLGAYITGNVYGGGKLADVGKYHTVTENNVTSDEIDIVGNTYVIIGAKENTSTHQYASVTLDDDARITITGDVFGGGKGDEDDTFRCGKAMVTGGTSVIIGNGLIDGTVYGGGEVGRVEGNTLVTIGIGAGETSTPTSAPVIKENVFGAGKGLKTHGYSALVRGKTIVTIEGNAKVGESVYGGGEIASVGRFKVKNLSSTDAPSWLPMGMPYSLWDAETESGKCTVTVQGYAEIGPDGMQMTATGGPDDAGHVFGAGRGVTPEVYSYEDKNNMPKRMMAYDETRYKSSYGSNEEQIIWEYHSDTDHENVWEYFDTEAKYLTFIETMALANKTDVTIDANAFVKGSVYGGSENGQVKHDTFVKIRGGQIGEGKGETTAYNPDKFINPVETTVTESYALKPCATWTYENNGYTYDKFAESDGTYSYTGKYSVIPVEEQLSSSEGGRPTATDGHTFYGNVFGGGSGYYPYAPGKWHSKAGVVGGNTRVDIEGGHILSNVYGGNEQTDVGSYSTTDIGAPKIEEGGTCTINMKGGTVGVPRIKTQIEALPVIGNIFGAGKGDKRVLFNTKTNVRRTFVNGTGGIVYGSVFGGGEDGHVMEDATTTIEQDSGKTITIGSTGESTADGNVFGGGRGSETALTAGVVGGNVILTINSGRILGSVYGGGRLASVGTNFVSPTIPDPDHEGQTITNPNYGKLQTPDADHGNITITINDGTIGQPTSTTGVNGNIIGGSKGTTANFLLGIARSTTINMTGGTAYSSVYGGGELAQVVGYHTTGGQNLGTEINISGGTIGNTIGNEESGNVYGGGKGNVTDIEAGLVNTNTKVSISQAESKTTKICNNVYGGGAFGSLGTFTISEDFRTFTWGNPYNNTGVSNVIITGGKIGEDGSSYKGNVFGGGKGIANTFWCEKGIAYKANVNISNGTVKGNVYGGGEVGRVETDTEVKIGDGAGSSEGTAAPTITGSVFGGGAGLETHGYSALVRGNTTVTVEGNAAVGNSVYGGGEIASVGKYGLDDNKMPSILKGGGYCYVTVQGYATVGSDVFGAGKGVNPHFEKGNSDVTKNSRRMTTEIDNTSTSTWVYTDDSEQYVWEYFQDEATYLNYLPTLALATHPEVTIDGNATVGRSVFGGGEVGLTKGSVIVNIKDGTVEEDVYGGGALADTNTTSTVDLDNDGITETVHPTTTVNLIGGLIKGDAYGGGLGQKTGFDGATSDIEATVYGNITVNLGTLGTAATNESPAIPGTATVFNTSYENTDEKDENNQFIQVIKSGRLFGCNNLNGSPQGDVTVNVYKTVAGTLAGSPNPRTEADPENSERANRSASEHRYEVAAVYGGGNLADYTATGKKASVIIHSCDVSVQYVYGGGNAAAVPETDVLVKGAWEIDHVFGGGNGKDKYKRGNEWIANAGANVNGNTNTLLIGGYIHEAYGGSNERGTITGNATINTDSEHEDCACALELVKLYGAGKNADIDGDLIVVLGCAPETKTEEIYGGAENANVRGNVELTITSGTFGKVFGGNNQSGAIFGHIILNIEETGCRPIIIDELYGCGNNAAYSVYGYKSGTDAEGNQIYLPRTSSSDGEAVVFKKNATQEAHTTPQYDDPEVNIISCTRIDKVFGGGLGSGATVYGNPTVNINQIYGKAYIDEAKTQYDAVAESLGEIGDVFGGGNAANVMGNTTVNIGTLARVSVKGGYVVKTVNEGASVEGLYILSGEGKYTAATGTAVAGTTYYEEKIIENDVIGANIHGNVYGGGNEAEVTGDTNVVIGRKDTSTSTSESSEPSSEPTTP